MEQIQKMMGRDVHREHSPGLPPAGPQEPKGGPGGSSHLGGREQVKEVRAGNEAWQVAVRTLCYVPFGSRL